MITNFQLFSKLYLQKFKSSLQKQMLIWLLYFSLLFLLFTSLILIYNRIYLKELPINIPPDRSFTPTVSLCIPARNEEGNLQYLLSGVLSQTYKNYEVLILDDESTDKTPLIIEKYRQKAPSLIKKIRGEPKPPEWLGKPWACRQLSEASNGSILIFADADTRLMPNFIGGIVNAFRKHNPDMLTVWPMQSTCSFAEKCVIPLVYFTLFTFLPTRFASKKPFFLPDFIYEKIAVFFAAANGQCVAFKKEAYSQIGGHESVKKEVVEDVELAKNIVRQGLNLKMYTGIQSIRCRMYNNHKNMLNGFRKNFYAGFRYNLPLFLCSAALHVTVYILPFFLAPYAFITGNILVFQLSMAIIAVILLQRLIIALWQKSSPLYAFTHPFGVLWFQWLALITLIDHYKNRRVSWKDRPV